MHLQPAPGCISGEYKMKDERRAGRPLKFFWLASRLLSVMLLGAPGLAAAGDAAPVDFRIPAQTVPAALSDFARQARVQFFFISDGFESVRANAVFGTYTRQEALDLLLEGTGLRASLSHGSGIEVKPVSGAMRGVGGSSQLVASAEVPGRAAGSTEIGEERGSPNQDAPASGSTGRKASEAIEEVVVTGTHIRGAENVGVSSITINRHDIEQAGYSTVADVFETLPQNLDEINVDGTVADGVSSVADSNGPLASGISLRGLGPGSTLVLLNGKRRPASVEGRVVDVSAIPLAMVERIEIVTGGRSAVYGSDAVAGVVNVVTRTETEGAETQVYYGKASAGASQFDFSQTFGWEMNRGGFVLGYDHRKEGELDATDTGLVRAPSIVGASPVPGLFRVRVPSEQDVGLFAGHYELNGDMELYADANYSSDRNEGGQLYEYNSYNIGGLFVTDSNQYSVVGGLRARLGQAWQIDVSGLSGAVNNVASISDLFGPAGTITSFNAEPTTQSNEDSSLTSLSVIADGPLGSIAGRTVSVAAGVDFRNEGFRRVTRDLSAGTKTPRENIDREIWSVFGELLFPLVDDVQRLEVSLAGRYDKYSDFGDTFNPQLGIEWEPVDGLIFRGSYSRAFRAPDLYTLAGTITGRVRLVDDPNAPGTTVALFSQTGGNPDLQPEEADTYSIGLEWEFANQGRVSLTYFDIEYQGRIDQPSALDFTALQDEAVLGRLVDRNPTPEQVQQLLANATRFINSTNVPFDPATDDPFAVFSNIVTYDYRANNIGLEQVDGIDLQASRTFDTGSGEWLIGVNGTYYLDFTRNITSKSPTIDQLNRPGRPVDLKIRGQVAWSRPAWSINAYLNYVDSYDDTIATTPTRIDSWTTVDLTVRLDTSQWASSGLFHGINATLAMNNALDNEPPVFLSNLYGLGYDGVNASPVGRFVSLRLSKHW